MRPFIVYSADGELILAIMNWSELRVLELCSVLAGPSVGMFFAELGCPVVKVESPSGDITRRWKLPTESEDASVSAYYASVNWGKEVHFLDYRNPQDFAQVQELIRRSDVILTNFKSGDAEKFGLRYADITALQSNAIVGEINGFGPESTRAAFDVVLQAETGFISMNGLPGGEPVKMPVALIDVLAAHQLKEGLLVALLQEKRPARVSVSLYEAALASLVNQATNYLMEGHIPQPLGTCHPNIAPYGDLFYSKDGLPLVLAVGNNKQFQALCELLQLPMSPEFESNESRVKNRPLLQKHLQERIALHQRQELFEQCLSRSIPMGRVLNLSEVFDEESAQALVLSEKQQGQETRRVKGSVFTISY